MKNNDELAKTIMIFVAFVLLCLIMTCCDKKDNRSDKDRKPRETVRVWVIDHYVDFEKIR